MAGKELRRPALSVLLWLKLEVQPVCFGEISRQDLAGSFKISFVRSGRNYVKRCSIAGSTTV